MWRILLLTINTIWWSYNLEGSLSLTSLWNFFLNFHFPRLLLNLWSNLNRTKAELAYFYHTVTFFLEYSSWSYISWDAQFTACLIRLPLKLFNLFRAYFNGISSFFFIAFFIFLSFSPFSFSETSHARNFEARIKRAWLSENSPLCWQWQLHPSLKNVYPI